MRPADADTGALTKRQDGIITNAETSTSSFGQQHSNSSSKAPELRRGFYSFPSSDLRICALSSTKMTPSAKPCAGSPNAWIVAIQLRQMGQT